MATKDVIALGGAYTGKTFSLERAFADDEEFEDYDETYYETYSGVVRVNSKALHVNCHELGFQHSISDGGKNLLDVLKKVKGVLLFFDRSNVDSVEVLEEIVDKNKREIGKKPVVLVANTTRETILVSNDATKKLAKSLSHVIGTEISTVEIPYIPASRPIAEYSKQLKAIFHEIGKKLTFRVQPPAEFKVDDGSEAFKFSLAPLQLLPLHTRPKHKPRGGGGGGIPKISDPIGHHHQQRKFKENSERERERYGYEKLLKRIEELEKSLERQRQNLERERQNLERERQERKKCFSLLNDKVSFIFKSLRLKFR